MRWRTWASGATIRRRWRGIRQNEISDYFAAAQQINDSGADVVWLQHEYGIFGGSAGGMIHQLMDRVAAPLVVTLQIGSASWRARVGRYGKITGVAGSIKK